MLLQNLRLVLRLLGNDLRQGRDATTGPEGCPREMVGAVIRGRRQILRVSLRQQLLHAGNEFKQHQIAPPMRDVWRNTIRRLKINQLRAFDFHEFTDRLPQVAEPLTVPRPRLKLWIPERKPDAFVARDKLSTFLKPSHKTLATLSSVTGIRPLRHHDQDPSPRSARRRIVDAGMFGSNCRNRRRLLHCRAKRSSTKPLTH